MSDALMKQLSAKIRNLFSFGSFERRFDNGSLQVKTAANRVLEQKEAFPYGFYAKAKKGKVLIFCQGGNFNGFQVLPVLADDSVEPPKLQDGDVAVYTEKGGWIALRDDGSVELFGKNAGGVIKVQELVTQLNKLSVRVDGIINALNGAAPAPTDGGAALKASIITVLATLVDKENFSNLESDKVFHGTGK